METQKDVEKNFEKLIEMNRTNMRRYSVEGCT
jgi:hypothetical protein